MLAVQPAEAAPLSVVSACTGASLPPSRLTSVLKPLVTGIFTPFLGLGGIGGGLLAGVDGIVTNAVSGGPIGLDVLTVNANGVPNGILGPGTQCSQQAGGFTITTPKGITIGGNSIDGLGAAGLTADAGDLSAIALGNGAKTTVNVTNAVAIGTNASATTSGGVALGANSVDRAAVATPTGTIGTVATTFAGGAPTSVVSVGAPGAERQIVNVAAGQLSAASTDAVNGSQLFATNTQVGVNTAAITNLNAGAAGPVQQTGVPNGLTLVAPGGTGAVPGAPQTLGNVANGVAPTDAVNLGQVGTLIGTSSAAAPIQYSNAIAPTVATPGVTSNSTTLVGLTPGTPVALHNVAAGSTLAGSTDAVNGDQLGTTNANVANNTFLIGGNTTAIANLSAGINNGTLGLVQQTGGSPGAGQITVGAATGGTSLNVAGTGGNRTISGVAAGVAPTDAANVGQLTATVGAATANSVQYDVGAGGRINKVTLAGGAPGPVALTNVAAGSLAAGSTDGVNGSQLGATNTNVAGNTTAITNLTNGTAGLVQQAAAGAPITVGAANGGTSVDFTGTAGTRTLSGVTAGVAATDAVNLGQVGALVANSAAASPIQYSAAAAPTTPTPGVVSNSTTLVGLTPGTPVALHNVDVGAVTATSTDAVNGSQLAATNAQTATNTTNIAGNTTAITNLTNGTAGLVQQTGGSPGAGQITVGGGTGGTSVTIAGTDGNRTLTGLAGGLAGNDAVTVAQVNGLTGNGLNNVQYDPTAIGGRSNTITLAGGTPDPVTITGLAAGSLAAGSSDAVNGSQLGATNAGLAATTAQVATNTTNIAGNTTTINQIVAGQAGAFRSDNTAAAPAPVASGANATAGGFGASATGAGGLALGNGATSTGTGSVVIGQGSTDGGNARVVSVGGVGSERRITNVGPAVNGTDAVNLSQLQSATTAFQTSAAGLQGQINSVNFDLNKVRRRANGGTAGAMAVAGLPQAFEPGKSMIGGAFGFWQDQVAFAVGASRIVGDQTVLKAGASISGQGVGGFNLGAGFQF